ncbi:hypothetical protein IJM86_03780 [bacterium]|nr:hypothetical protein [bacterium]
MAKKDTLSTQLKNLKKKTPSKEEKIEKKTTSKTKNKGETKKNTEKKVIKKEKEQKEIKKILPEENKKEKKENKQAILNEWKEEKSQFSPELQELLEVGLENEILNEEDINAVIPDNEEKEDIFESFANLAEKMGIKIVSIEDTLNDKTKSKIWEELKEDISTFEIKLQHLLEKGVKT